MNFVEERGHLLDLVHEDDRRAAPLALFDREAKIGGILGVAEELVVTEEINRPGAWRQLGMDEGALARLAT